jgi:cytokinin dehydrogenase
MVTRSCTRTFPALLHRRIMSRMFSTDDEALSWASADFGHVVHGRPAAVLRPGSVSEIVTALASGVPVRPRGEGHSTGGQAQQPGGVVLDMRGWDEVLAVTSSHVVVQAGARWSSVVAAALPFGVTPPVLTDYLELSVGGTLSVGGIGGMSHQHGFQVDNVTELEVLVPTGTIHVCRPGDRLFDLVRGGYGEHGIILRATLRVVPAYSEVWRYRLLYESLPGFLADQRTLLASRRFDYLEGRAEPEGGFEIEAVSYGRPGDPAGLSHASVKSVERLPYFSFLNRLAEGEALLRSTGDWDRPHPWLNVFVPDSAIESWLAGFVTSTTREDIGTNGTVLVYPFDTTMITAPLVPLPASRVAFIVAVLRTAADPPALRRMLAANSVWRQRTLKEGGTVYLDVSRGHGGGTR